MKLQYVMPLVTNTAASHQPVTVMSRFEWERHLRVEEMIASGEAMVFDSDDPDDVVRWLTAGSR